MRADVHTLAGSSVLDAVSAAERTQFARHLAQCAPCEQEAAELRDTVTWLALAVSARPPPALKSLVLADIAVGGRGRRISRSGGSDLEIG